MRSLSRTRSERTYAHIARIYDTAHHLQTLWADTYHRREVVRAAAPSRSERVLEIGCGTGLLTRQVVNVAGRVVAVDLSQDMLALARRRSEIRRSQNVVILHADACDLPFDTGSFDVVISAYGLGGIDDIYAAVTEIHRVLKRGGRVVAVEMTEPSRSRPLLRRIHLNAVEPFIRLVWEFRDLDLYDLFQSNGFVVRHEHYYRNRMLGSSRLVHAVPAAEK